MRRKTKILFRLSLIFCLVIILLVAFANFSILASYPGSREKYTIFSEQRYVLIFGGGMKPNGSMSEMQEDRVKKGIEIYKAGKARKIIMTGDDGARRQDEVTAMRQYALEAGVPAENITVDPHGYRTYLSCERAARVYGVTSAFAVSQSFHLPRIIYFCKSFGIDTVGVSSDLRDYNSWWIQNGREALARFKGWLEIGLLR